MNFSVKKISFLCFVSIFLFAISDMVSAQTYPPKTRNSRASTLIPTPSSTVGCCMKNGKCVSMSPGVSCAGVTNCAPCAPITQLGTWGVATTGIDCISTGNCNKQALPTNRNGQIFIDKMLVFGGGRLLAGQQGIGISGNFEPIKANSFNLGSVKNSFKAVYTKRLIAEQVSKPSDRRLKTNIAELPYGLQTVLQLKPSIYHYKNNIEGKQELGLIAQDLQETVPEVVVEGEEFLSVDYTALVPVLIQAIQEQQAIIEAQKSTIEVQKTTMEQTQSELKDLKANLTEVMDFLQLKEQKVGSVNE
ncbi:MAG: tail fiber domain-containing protein [Chitinophagales bacterium]